MASPRQSSSGASPTTFRAKVDRVLGLRNRSTARRPTPHAFLQGLVGPWTSSPERPVSEGGPGVARSVDADVLRLLKTVRNGVKQAGFGASTLHLIDWLLTLSVQRSLQDYRWARPVLAGASWLCDGLLLLLWAAPRVLLPGLGAEAGPAATPHGVRALLVLAVCVPKLLQWRSALVGRRAQTALQAARPLREYEAIQGPYPASLRTLTPAARLGVFPDVPTAGATSRPCACAALVAVAAVLWLAYGPFGAGPGRWVGYGLGALVGGGKLVALLAEGTHWFFHLVQGFGVGLAVLGGAHLLAAAAPLWSPLASPLFLLGLAIPGAVALLFGETLRRMDAYAALAEGQ